MSTTTLATDPVERQTTFGDILRAAEAQGVKPSTLLDKVPAARSITASGVAIKPMSVSDITLIAIEKPTPTEMDWAEGNLEGLKTIVQPTRHQGPAGEVSIEQSSDGLWWRFGGNIELRIHGGEYRFQISLYRGANWDDYEHLQLAVDKAKRGNFLNAGWWKYTDRNGNEAFSWHCGRAYAKAGEATMFDAVVDDSPEILVCTDDRCIIPVHQAFGSTHVADSAKSNKWMLSVDRYVDQDHEDDEYAVSIHASEAFSEAELVDFVSDLKWMQESCRRANAKSATSPAEALA